MGNSARGLVLYLILSITAALIIALLLRLPLRKWFGAQIAYGLWMVVPLLIVATVLPAGDGRGGIVPRVSIGSALESLTGQWVTNAHRDDPAHLLWLWAVWVAGAGVFWQIQTGRQSAFVRGLEPLHRTATGEWITQAQTSPAVVGALRPRIVLPADFFERYSAQEQELVLAHERMHIQRFDPAVNLVIAVIRAVLWFHPLTYIAARCLRIDQELACDAAVIAGRPMCRATYAHALLKTQLAVTGSSSACSWDSETARSLNRRFVMLKTSMPTRSRRLAGATVITVTALAAAGLSWAAQPQAAEPQSISTLAGVDLVGAKTVGEIVDRCQRAENPPLVTINGQAVTASAVDLNGVTMARIARIEVAPVSVTASRGAINIVLR